MEELSTIILSGKTYPIRCSNYVLAKVQEKYGSISAFERKLTGREPQLDESGKEKRDEEGMIIYAYNEPSMEAINFFLPLCINEGLEVEAILHNKSAEPMDDAVIIRMDYNPFKISIELRQEFYRAFAIKK